MPVETKALPVRILKVWFDICLVLGAIAAALFLLYLFISSLFIASEDQAADAVVQVSVGSRALLPVYRLEYTPIDSSTNLGIQRASLVKARGELRMVTTNRWLFLVSVGGVMVGTGIVLYVIWILRKILINVLDDRPFDAANGRYLRRSGLIILAVGAFWPFFDYAFANHVLSRIDVTNLELHPAITLQEGVLEVGLLFLIFAAILTRGHQLEEEKALLEEENQLTI